jgi:ABC-type nickel/cobalt efflux system permease component RcnA
MQRIILTLFLLQTWLFGCLSCDNSAIYIKTHLDFQTEKKQLQKIRVTWELDPIFSQYVLGDFDINRNNRFDPQEQKEVYSQLAPLSEKNFYTAYTLNGTPITFDELLNFEVRFEEGVVLYSFNISAYLDLYQPVSFFGDYQNGEAREDAIFFHLDAAAITLNGLKAPALKAVSQEHTDRDGWMTTTLKVTLEAVTEKLPEPYKVADITEDSTAFTLSMQEMIDRVHTYLVEMKEEPSVGAVIMILLLSLLYGMVHAAGPGHGKMLVASYFVANDHSYVKAIFLGLMIAAVHVFSALLLTMGLYYLIDAVFSQTLQEATRYITMGSGLIIITIALYLFWKKWRFYHPNISTTVFTASRDSMNRLAPQYAAQSHLSSCSCHSCKTTQGSTDLPVVIMAGIVPCPGTVIIFMFAISMSLYILGFASAVIMSLGMGVTIALTAVISTKVKRSARIMGSKAIKIIEFGSLAVMGGLGLFLLFA